MTGEWLRQDGYAVRFEVGATGARELARLGDVVVVVDVLSFSTTVSVAMDRGMRVRPLADDSVAHDVPTAVRREAMDADHPWSLSPASIRSGPQVDVLALPSPNGARIAEAAATCGAVVFAGCLRNAHATAIAARRAARGTDPAGQRRRPENAVLVMAAGERWPDGTLRPALEDLLGAGAIIDALVRSGVPIESCSPEARMALHAWQAVDDLTGTLRGCVSGRELVERGYPHDIHIAAELDASALAAHFTDGAFTAVIL